MASKRNGTLYTGVTRNIARRAFEHKEGKIKGFTKQYNVHRLVYFEGYELIVDAIKREKVIKKWNRQWKLELIEKNNPQWRDLAEDFNKSDPNFTDALTHYAPID